MKAATWCTLLALSRFRKTLDDWVHVHDSEAEIR